MCAVGIPAGARVNVYRGYITIDLTIEEGLANRRSLGVRPSHGQRM